jgi:hypothetical protein
MPGLSTNSGNDAVMTPLWLAQECIEWAGTEPGMRVYEPCCGVDSGFTEALLGQSVQYIASGKERMLVEWAEITLGRDMFEHDPGQVDLVITNPPYSLLGRFIPHMLNVTRPTRMVLLAPLTNLVTKKRLRDTFDAGYSFSRIHIVEQLPPPAVWPASGFQQCFVEYSQGDHHTQWTRPSLL